MAVDLFRVSVLVLVLAVPVSPDPNGRGDRFWRDLEAFNTRYVAFLERLHGCPGRELMRSIDDCDPARGEFDERLWLGVDGAARRLFGVGE